MRNSLNLFSLGILLEPSFKYSLVQVHPEADGSSSRSIKLGSDTLFFVYVVDIMEVFYDSDFDACAFVGTDDLPVDATNAKAFIGDGELGLFRVAGQDISEVGN